MYLPKGLPYWPLETVVILGGGPSLDPDCVTEHGGIPAQVEHIRRVHEAGKCRVIGVNRAYRIAPWMDLLHANDEEFWLNHPQAVAWPGIKTTGQGTSGIQGGENIILIKMAPKYTAKPFADPMRPIHAGRDSGYQAIQLAALLGASRVVLMGFDARSVGRYGKHNWHEGYEFLGRRKPCDFEMHKGLHDDLAVVLKAKGVDVLNCSPGSAITAYPMASIEEALPLPREMAA